MRTKTPEITHDPLNVGNKLNYLPVFQVMCNQNGHFVCMSKNPAHEIPVVGRCFRGLCRVDQHLRKMGFVWH
jgi:hypothetical protein